MEAFTYKGISDGKYVDGEIEALNLDEASHKLKEQKVIITNIVRSSSKKKTDKKDKKKSKGSSLFGKKKAKVEDVVEKFLDSHLDHIAASRFGSAPALSHSSSTSPDTFTRGHHLHYHFPRQASSPPTLPATGYGDGKLREQTAFERYPRRAPASEITTLDRTPLTDLETTVDRSKE